MAKSLYEHAPAIPCGLAAFAQCIQRQHAQGVEHIGTAEPEWEGMFSEQIHAACSVAGNLGIRRHMRIRGGMEDPDGRTAPDRSTLVCFQQIVCIFSAAVGQACTGAKPGIEAKIFYDFGPEELQICFSIFKSPDLTYGSILAQEGETGDASILLPITVPAWGWRWNASATWASVSGAYQQSSSGKMITSSSPTRERSAFRAVETPFDGSIMCVIGSSG